MPKISQYPAQTGASVANGDLFPIVDVGSPNVSEYITADELAQIPQLTSRYASATAFPSGAYSNTTPTVTAETGTITTVGGAAVRYIQLGKLVHCFFGVGITTKGTAAGSLQFTLPVTASSNITSLTALGMYRESANTGVMGVVLLLTNTEVVLRRYDNSTPFQSDGDVFRGSFTYEAA